MEIKGWLTDKEADVLRRHSTGRVLEIGTWRGKSTEVLAEGASIIWTVDPHDGMKDLGGSWREFLTWMSESDIRNVIPVRATFEHALTHSLLPTVVDFCYIDGDHSEESVLYDIFGCLRICDGPIALHDYGEPRYGVKKVVDRLIASRCIQEIGETADRMIVVRRAR